MKVDITVPIQFEWTRIKEDENDGYDYLIPNYPLGLCKFDELDAKCKELKAMLEEPQSVVDVYVPTKEECKSMPKDVRACGDWWWTSTTTPDGNVWLVDDYGDLYGNYHSYSLGFRPIIVRKKDPNSHEVRHDNYNKILTAGDLKKYLQNVPDNSEIICDTHDKNFFATRGYMNEEQWSWVNHVEAAEFNAATLYIHAAVPEGLEKCRFCSAPANTIEVSAFTGMTSDEGVGSIDIDIPHIFVDAEECCDYFRRYSDEVSMVSYDEISYTVSVPFEAVRAAAADYPNCMWLKDICEKVIDNIKDGTGDVDFQFGAPFPEDNGGTTLARIPYPVGTKCKYRKSSCDEWKDGEIYAYIIGKNNRITKVEIADFEMFEIAGIEIPNATVYDWGMDFDSNVSVLL